MELLFWSLSRLLKLLLLLVPFNRAPTDHCLGRHTHKHTWYTCEHKHWGDAFILTLRDHMIAYWKPCYIFSNNQPMRHWRKSNWKKQLTNAMNPFFKAIKRKVNHCTLSIYSTRICGCYDRHMHASIRLSSKMFGWKFESKANESWTKLKRPGIDLIDPLCIELATFGTCIRMFGSRLCLTHKSICKAIFRRKGEKLRNCL